MFNNLTKNPVQKGIARHSCYLGVAVASALVSLPAAAQTRVEPVVVTAWRTSEALAETLRDVSILRGEDLLAAGVNDVVSALQSVPGLEVQALGAGATPSIFARGGNSNQVLVLIDGQRIGSSFSGLSALQHLAIDQIERIEIVRGPAASLYGADAVSAVIQVFTKKRAGLSANVMLGEQRSSDVGVRAGYAQDGRSASLAFNHRESAGYNAIVNPQNFSFNPDRDGYRFTSAQASAGLALSTAWQLDANLYAARGNVQYDGGAGFDDRIKSQLHSGAVKLGYAATERWRSTVTLGQSVDQATFVSAFGGEYKTTQTQASWQNNLRLQRDLALWNAVEWRREAIATTDSFDTTSRRTTSFAFGAEAALSALKLAGSLRIDDSSQYGTRSTGNLALGWRVSPQWRVLANAGTSFKAPTFNDLYYPGYANPALAPEKAKNFDLGLQWTGGGSNATLVLYENRVRDLIEFQCDANFNCAPQNVATATLRGATLSAGTRIADWRVEASLDLSDPENTTTGKRLARRANVHGALKANTQLFGANLGLEWVASGNRFDNPANTRRLAGYGVLNAFVRHELWRGVNVGARLDNALDRDYQHAFGYATGGRKAWLTLSVN